MLKQSAAAFTANDLAVVSNVLRHPGYGHIADSLVRSFCLIMRKEFGDKIVEMFLAENHEMAQAFFSSDQVPRRPACFLAARNLANS